MWDTLSAKLLRLRQKWRNKPRKFSDLRGFFLVGHRAARRQALPSCSTGSDVRPLALAQAACGVCDEQLAFRSATGAGDELGASLHRRTVASARGRRPRITTRTTARLARDPDTSPAEFDRPSCLDHTKVPLDAFALTSIGAQPDQRVACRLIAERPAGAVIVLHRMRRHAIDAARCLEARCAKVRVGAGKAGVSAGLSIAASRPCRATDAYGVCMDHPATPMNARHMRQMTA